MHRRSDRRTSRLILAMCCSGIDEEPLPIECDDLNLQRLRLSRSRVARDQGHAIRSRRCRREKK